MGEVHRQRPEARRLGPHLLHCRRRGRSLLIQQGFDVLRRPPEYGARSAFNDGTLEEVGILDHESNDLVVGEFASAESEFFIDGLARPQQFARRQPHLLYQLTQLRLAERLDVVVDLPVIDAALTEQPRGLAALGSSRLLVDCDFVFHGFSP